MLIVDPLFKDRRVLLRLVEIVKHFNLQALQGRRAQVQPSDEFVRRLLDVLLRLEPILVVFAKLLAQLLELFFLLV